MNRWLSRAAWSLTAVSVLLGSPALAIGGGPEREAVATLAADMEQTVVTSDGTAVVTRSKLFLAGATARVEPETEPGRIGYTEFHLYDFTRERFFRVFPDDRIYFELALTAPLAARAVVEGWAPPPRGAVTRSIPLKDDWLEGMPASLALVERRVKGKPEYALVWTAAAWAPLPVRVTYTASGSRTVTVTYRHVERIPFDPGRFAVPVGYADLSPF